MSKGSARQKIEFRSTRAFKRKAVLVLSLGIL
jgi:hypothetical protein